LLAKIDTPEVDQELTSHGLRASRFVAQMEIAKITADRWQTFSKPIPSLPRKPIRMRADTASPSQPGCRRR